MQDQAFFSNGDVHVSLTRFVVSGKTYAMSGITSVKASSVAPSRFLPLVLGAIGALCLLAGGAGVLFGLIFLAVAVLIWIVQKPEYIVQLSSASGELQALTSNDQSYVMAIVQALNDCIIARG